jgi:hypothetical protein
MLLDDFKKTVDSYSATIPSGNLLEICEHLGIDTSSGYSRNQVSDKLYENIKESLAFDSKIAHEKISRAELSKLKSELVYRYVLYKEDPVEYLNILELVVSCLHNGDYFPPFAETSKWKEAIINSKNYNKFSAYYSCTHIGKIRDDYPKDFDRAESVS